MQDKDTALAEVSWLRLMIAAADIGPQRLGELLETFESAEALFESGRRACAALTGEGPSRRLFSDETLEQAQSVLHWLQTTPQAGFVSWADADFPREALAFDHAPSILLFRGRRELLKSRRIALAGAVRPDREGRQNAASFSAALIREERSVVSFLEDETDEEVVRAALSAQTGGEAGLIVLSATGPDRLYPSSMRDLFHRAAQDGLIITPFMPGTGVSEDTKQARHVLCAYLCPELLVLQAELPGSTHALARLFAEYNRDVFAIPGSIHCSLYKGNHKLLREGARLAETVSDITQFGSESV